MDKMNSSGAKEWRGLVLPVAFLLDIETLLSKLEVEEFEEKSQVDFNTDTITFIGKVSLKKFHYSDSYSYSRPALATLFDGIKEILRRFKVEFVPQNVIVKVNCYPNTAICIKLSGSKEEKAMVTFLQKIMESYNKIVADTQKECEGNQFKIEVRRLTGKGTPLIVDPYTPIDMLKLKISKNVCEETPPKQLRLTSNRKQLEDGQTLADYGIGDKDIIHVIYRLKGGGGASIPWYLPLAGILECPICLELLFAPVALNCTHNFCQHCIGKWRKEKSTCPSCRELIQGEYRVHTLDKILEKVESEMDEQEDKEKREEQKRKHSQFMKNHPRQVGNAIPEEVVARDVIRREMTEFVSANGILSQVRIQFDHAPAVINPEDTEFELFRNVFNTNEEYERQELL